MGDATGNVANTASSNMSIKEMKEFRRKSRRIIEEQAKK